MLHIKYFPIKRFFYQRPLIFVLRNVKGLKLKSFTRNTRLQNTMIGDAINLVLGLFHILSSSFIL